MTKLQISAIFLLVVRGTERQYLTLYEGVTLESHPELATLLGEGVGIEMLGTGIPAVDSPEEDALVKLSEAALITANETAGYVLPPATDTKTIEGWNALLADFTAWLGTEEAPAAEQETVVLTSEEAQTVVNELQGSKEGSQALENAVTVVEEETGLQLPESAAIAFLQGKKILAAQRTSRDMSGVAETKVGEAMELLIDAYKLIKGDNAFKDAMLGKLEQSELPAETAHEEVVA